MPSKNTLEGFEITTKLLFSQKFSDIDSFESWLTKHVPNYRFVKKEGQILAVPTFGAFNSVPNSKFALNSEFDEISNKKLDISKIDLNALSNQFSNTVNFVVSYNEGNNIDIESSSIYKDGFALYKVLGNFDCKYAAFTSWCDFNDHVYGSYRTFHTKFSINCYSCDKLTQCFEMDGCNNCTDCMFCHNCENLEHALFCFNVNGLRYAIGNVEVGKDKFEQVKKMLQEKIASELEKNKKLGLSVFNLGTGN
jgi:hypothetical protein